MCANKSGIHYDDPECDTDMQPLPLDVPEPWTLGLHRNTIQTGMLHCSEHRMQSLPIMPVVVWF